MLERRARVTVYLNWTGFFLTNWTTWRDVKNKKKQINISSYLHEQYLEDFLNLKAERDRVFLGNGLVGGE